MPRPNGHGGKRKRPKRPPGPFRPNHQQHGVLWEDHQHGLYKMPSKRASGKDKSIQQLAKAVMAKRKRRMA